MVMSGVCVLPQTTQSSQTAQLFWRFPQGHWPTRLCRNKSRTALDKFYAEEKEAASLATSLGKAELWHWGVQDQKAFSLTGTLSSFLPSSGFN